MNGFLYCAAVFVVTFVLVRLVIHINIKDRPNDRSLHEKPTPKSGGLGFAVPVTAAIAAAHVATPDLVADVGLTSTQWGIYLGSLVFVVLLALADDIWVLSAAVKLSGQIAVAILFAVTVGHVQTLHFPGLGLLDLHLFGYVFTFLWIAFFMNAFNFMDGINGIAGGSAVVAGLFLALIAGQAVAGGLAFMTLVLAAGVLGFLPYNYPKASIFMGDTGSQFIAFLFATMAVLGARAGDTKISFFIVPLLFLPFLFDVTLTLIRRSVRGEAVWKAHREHVYQTCIRLGRGHTEVSAVYFLLAFVSGVAALRFSFRPDIHALYGIILLMLMFGALAYTVHQTMAEQQR